MIKIELTKSQSQVVNFDKGPLLVKASAGSGKTLVLIERIRKLIPNTRRRILAITFTNKAADEIKDRLESENKDILKNKVIVTTFHGFCNRVLESQGSSIGYYSMPQIFGENDRRRVLEETIRENPELNDWYNSLLPKEKKGKINQLVSWISKVKRDFLIDSEWNNQREDKELLVYQEYNERLLSQNAIDFDDLFRLTYQIFTFHSNIASLYRRNYEYVCVDEAQDMNNAQYSVLTALLGDSNKNIMLVGDENQSIYAFNGSSSQYMSKNFVEDFSPTIITLNENFRSARSILNYANLIVPNSEVVDNVPIKGICQVNQFNDVDSEATFVCDKIENIVNDNNNTYCYDDITVLARNRYILTPIENLLKEKNIQYCYKVSLKGLDFDSTSAKVFDLILVVCNNPKDKLHLRMLQEELNNKENPLQDNLEFLNKIADPFIRYIASQALTVKKDCTNYLHIIKGILKSIEAGQFKDTPEELDLSFAEFKRLRESWIKYASSRTNYDIMSFRNSLMLGQNITLTKEKGVQLSTVHSMKGQQNYIIFLIGMDDGTFPDYRAVNAGGEALRQENNNLYVAVTRARRRLYISYPLTRQMPWGDIYNRYKSRLLP